MTKYKDFTPIPDTWSDPNFTFVERFIVARILRFQNNNNQYFLKRQDFCEQHGMSYRTYDYALKYLKQIGIVEISKKTAKNISWLTINTDALLHFVESGFPSKKDGDKRAYNKCQKSTIEVTIEHSDSDNRAQVKCQKSTGPVTKEHHSKSKQANRQGNIESNIQNNIESNIETEITSDPDIKANSFSFLDFKEEAKPKEVKDELDIFMDDITF
tara:strand:- start:501 stop:1142 length:642 start_codon:yes stop_codon:yes gene_type:complete